MTLEDVLHIISQGEGFTIEFKDAVGGTPSSFYESAVSMSNTDGGVIYLSGVEGFYQQAFAGEVLSGRRPAGGLEG